MGIFRSVIREFTREQVEFCSQLLGISPENFDLVTEENLENLYDMLCDIECGQDYHDGAVLTQEEEMASDLVTLMGNEIGKALGELCAPEDFA